MSKEESDIPRATRELPLKGPILSQKVYLIQGAKCDNPEIHLVVNQNILVQKHVFYQKLQV